MSEETVKNEKDTCNCVKKLSTLQKEVRALLEKIDLLKREVETIKKSLKR